MDIMTTYSFSLPGRRIDGRRFLEVAYDLLIFRKFDDVLNMCNVGSSNGHSSMEIIFPQTLKGISGSLLDNDMDPRGDDIISGEYAETIWRSILLHAKVHDFTTAENLAIAWLSETSNQTLTQYSSILELLVTHVLLPQTKLEEAKALVELNSGLSPEKKMTFLKYLEKIEEEWKMTNKAEIDEGSANESPRSAVMRIVERLSQMLTRLIPVTGLRYVRDIACLSFFIYLIVVRNNLELTSSMSHAAVLWSGIVRIWRSLFAPFHLMPKA